MQSQLKIFSYYLLPQHILSRLAGCLANCKIEFVKNFLIKLFIKHYNINLDEAAKSHINNYPDFNSFFTRALKENARPIADSQNAIVAPADGYITQLGKILQNELIQAKGVNFSLQNLIGEKEIAASFVNGNFATIYLSPKDYHRVHMPIAGTLHKMLYVPGQLFPVNLLSANNVPNLFARNERVIAIFDTAIGSMAIVMIGAMMVASIETVWAGTVAPASFKDIKIWDYTNEKIILQQGAELGRFKFGSTVILLFQENAMQLDANITTERSIKMGSKIGQIT